MTAERGTVEDLIEISEMGAEFFSDTRAKIAFNPAAWVAGWAALVHSGLGVLWVVRLNGKIVGALGAIWGPDLITGGLQAQEGFWWMKPEARGRGIALVKAFEAWARTVPGMTRIIMAGLKFNCDRLAKLYQRFGFNELETSFGKELA